MGDLGLCFAKRTIRFCSRRIAARFLKKAAAVVAGAPVMEALLLARKVRAAGDAAVNGSGWEKIIAPADPLMVNTVPSPAQLRYQTNQYGAFLHYGPAVFFGGKVGRRRGSQGVQSHGA